MMDRVAGESFLNPFDVDEMRDFNVFMLVVTFTTMIVHQASWIGAEIRYLMLLSYSSGETP